MPGFGVPAGLPGLPSPAQGVAATPDLFSGFAAAAPQFIQGEQEGMEMKEQRRKQAQETLQQLAPYAAADPHNPNTIKAIQKAFKQMGIDPRAAVNQDGSINQQALTQYNPYFQMFQNLAPTLSRYNPQALGKLGQMAGLPDEITKAFQNAVTPEAFDKSLSNLQKEIQNFGTGKSGFTKEALVSQAATLMSQAQDLGPQYMAAAQSIYTSAQQAQLGAATGAGIKHTEATTDLAKNQAKVAAANAILAQSRVGLVKAETLAEAHRVGLIDAQTQKAYADIDLATQRVQQGWQHLDLERQRLSSQNLSTAMRAATDYNKALNDIQSQIDKQQNILNYMAANNLTKKNGQPSLRYEMAVNTLHALRKMQMQYKPFDINSLPGNALIKAGLPNNQKVIPGGQSTSTGSAGSVSRKDLMAIARKYKKSLPQVIKDYEAKGYTINP